MLCSMFYFLYYEQHSLTNLMPLTHADMIVFDIDLH